MTCKFSSVLLAACLLMSACKTPPKPFEMGDPIQRGKVYPFTESWTLNVPSKNVREAAAAAIVEVGVTRIGIETADTDNYLESDFQGVIGAQTTFGETVLLVWEATADKQTHFQICRKTPERTYLCYALAMHAFKKLGLTIEVPPVATQPATATAPH